VTQPFADPPVTAYPSGAVLPECPGLFAPVQSGRGVFTPRHCSAFSALRYAFASFSALTASCVNVLLRKARSAIAAQVSCGVCMALIARFFAPLSHTTAHNTFAR